MATTPEGRVKATIKKYLATLPFCWWYMPVSNGMGRMGIPDFIVCYRGVFIGIETKAPGKEANVTPLQMQNIVGINNALGYSIVVSDVLAVRGLVEHIDGLKVAA